MIEVIHGGHDAVLEFLFGCDADMAQHRAGELGEEAFDEIEPRAVLGITVTLPSLPFCLGAGLASPLAGRDGAVEAAIAFRNASSPSGRPINSLRRSAAKAGSSASRVEKIGEARRAVDERLHAHEPVVAAGQMRA